MENKTVEQQKKELINKLSPRQREYLEAIDWLYTGGRGTGRTHLLCTVVLLGILNGNEPMKLIDHEVMHEGNRHYMLAVLHNLADDIGIKIKTDTRNNRVIYVWRDVEQLMYEHVSERWKE